MPRKWYCLVIKFRFKFEKKGFKYVSLSCISCNSSGRIQCTGCAGFGKLKWFIELRVSFENQENDFIKKSEDIPDELLRKCQAHSTFSEQNERVNI
jgi:hypothetical protein